MSWLDKSSKSKLSKISVTAANVLNKKFKTPSKVNSFTTFKRFKSNLSGNSYSRGFISISSRSTNDFRHKESMLYLANRYLKPIKSAYFSKGGSPIDQEQWALSEMLQWLWRGCIRDGKPMNVFIPSVRMRTLLIEWLDGERGNTKHIEQ